jgi:hypothetical protein
MVLQPVGAVAVPTLQKWYLPRLGANATKMVSAPSFHLNGSDGSFPGAHMKWVREHEKAGNK